MKRWVCGWGYKYWIGGFWMMGCCSFWGGGKVFCWIGGVVKLGNLEGRKGEGIVCNWLEGYIERIRKIGAM